MKTKLIAIIAIVCSLFARADLIQFENEVHVSDINASGTLTLPRFDTSLGSITSVYLYAYASVQAIWNYTNPTSNYLLAHGTVNTDLGVTFPNGNELLTINGPSSTTELVDPGSDYISVVPQNNANVTITTKSLFPNYQGAGDITFSYSSTGSSFHSEAVGLTYQSTAYVTDVYVRVIYYYDHAPVPPPANKNGHNNGIKSQ